MNKFIYHLTFFIIGSFHAIAQDTTQVSKISMVSIVELIAKPEQFNDQLIEIKGYFVDFGRYGRIYLSKEDANYMNNQNSIGVFYYFYDEKSDSFKELRKLNKNYVSIAGFFTNRKSPLYNGLITSVYNFAKLTP